MSKVVKEIVIDVVLFYFGGWIGKLGTTFAKIGTAVQAIALTRAIGFVAAAIQGQPRKIEAGLQDEYAGTVEPRRIIYGTALVGGMNVIPPWTSGPQNDYMHQVLAIAGHEVSAISKVYLNQEEVSSFGSITGTQDDGLITTSSFANYIWLRRYLGTSSQTVDYILTTAFPSSWDSTHRGRGVAYVAMQYKFDTTVYRNGKPLVRSLVDGKKVYDPRKDSTNGGSGAHRLATPSTWEFSANPALCLADYLMDATLGLGEDNTRIDWTLVAAAANTCDETVAIPPGSSTEFRYRCSLVLDATASYEQNIDAIAETMRGYVLYSGGKWLIYAGAWRTPDFTLTDDDVTGKVEIRTATPYKERWNAVRGQFVDASNYYQPIEYPPIRNSSDEATDGEGPVWRELNGAGVTSQYQAQRDAIVLQRMSRRKVRLVLDCGLSAFKIRPGDTGTVTLSEWGLSALSVRCTGWSFSPEGAIQLTLDEALSTDWTDPARADYQTTATSTTVASAAMVPAIPTEVSTVGLADSLVVSWKGSANAVPGTLYQVYEYSAATPFSSAVAIGQRTAQTSISIPRTSTTTAYFWVAAIFPNGQTSNAAMSAVTGVAGAAIAITAGFRITVTPTSVSKTVKTSGTTTASVTVTPISPAGSVTYTWTAVSGDTEISVDSASSATTTFSATGMAVETTYSRIFQVSAFDGTTTKTQNVNVICRRTAFV